MLPASSGDLFALFSCGFVPGWKWALAFILLIVLVGVAPVEYRQFLTQTVTWKRCLLAVASLMAIAVQLRTEDVVLAALEAADNDAASTDSESPPPTPPTPTSVLEIDFLDDADYDDDG